MLPLNTNYPTPDKEEDQQQYLSDLVKKIQDDYEEIALAVNGTIMSSVDTLGDLWTPSLKGTTIPGTFTYVNRFSWAVRVGIMVDIFFDISWTVTTATGNLYLELPYAVIKGSGIPFVGAVQTSTIAYSAGKSYLSCNAIPGTSRCEFWQSGSAGAMSNLAVPAVGQICGSVRYIGVSDE